jgi:hypothetical protein
MISIDSARGKSPGSAPEPEMPRIQRIQACDTCLSAPSADERQKHYGRHDDIRRLLHFKKEMLNQRRLRLGEGKPTEAGQ